MRNRSAVLVALLLSTGSSLLFPSAASAGECAGLTVVASCSSSPEPSPQPSPQPSPEPSPQPAPQPSPQPAAGSEDPAAAARILSLVNRDRAAAGLGALESRPQIVSIATGHSRTMASRREIFHNDAYFTASTRRSLAAKALGENVALNGSADDAHRRLMASPGHRANILDGNFDAIGVAVVRDGSGTLYVTENFVDSVSAAAAAPVPAPARGSREATAPRRAAPAASRAAAPAPAAPTAVPAPAEVVPAAVVVPAGPAPTPVDAPAPGRTPLGLLVSAVSGLLATAAGIGSWMLRGGGIA